MLIVEVHFVSRMLLFDVFSTCVTCVFGVFFPLGQSKDEIDAIGGKRFSQGTSADREIQRTLLLGQTVSVAVGICCWGMLGFRKPSTDDFHPSGCSRVDLLRWAEVKCLHFPILAKGSQCRTDLWRLAMIARSHPASMSMYRCII